MIGIDAIGGVTGDLPRMEAIVPNRATSVDFMNLVGDGLSRVDQSLKTADAQLRALATGQEIVVHDLMISMERARLDLMLAAEVRNRVVESYQELLRMQL